MKMAAKRDEGEAGLRVWGDGTPLLLLHGFTGGPEDLRLLAQALAGRGYACYVPTLPGHGETLEGLAHVEADDWLRFGLDWIERLRKEAGQSIGVVGFSAGGALAVRLAAARPDDVLALTLLAPALTVSGSGWLYRHLFKWRIASRLIPTVRKGAPDLLDPTLATVPRGERLLPTRAAAALDASIRRARVALPKVRCPTLVLWGAKDAVVPRRAAEEAAARIAGETRLVIFDDSAHQLALDADRERVFTEVGDFFERRHAEARG